MSEAHSLFTDEDQALLARTQEVRLKIINKLTLEKLPEDDSDRKFLLAALNGADSHIFSKAKIKVEDSANKSAAENTALISQVLLNAAKNKMRTNININNSLELGKEFITGPTVPGELDFSGALDLGIENLIPE